MKATDTTGAVAGEFVPRDIRRGGGLCWGDHELTLRPVSPLRERYALSEDNRALVLLDGKGWGGQPSRSPSRNPTRSSQDCCSSQPSSCTGSPSTHPRQLGQLPPSPAVPRAATRAANSARPPRPKPSVATAIVVSADNILNGNFRREAAVKRSSPGLLNPTGAKCGAGRWAKAPSSEQPRALHEGAALSMKTRSRGLHVARNVDRTIGPTMRTEGRKCKTPVNEPVQRRSSPAVAVPDSACHAGGRGFESRRSRLYLQGSRVRGGCPLGHPALIPPGLRRDSL